MLSPAIFGRLRALSLLTVAGASVLVFHSAALAQQPGPDADAAKGPPEPTAESAPKPAPPQDLPPEYAPPPGYHHPAPPSPPPQPGYEQAPGYGPYYAPDYYGPPSYPPPRYYRPRYYAPAPVRYYPEPFTYRPFFLGFGLGVGGVGIFSNQSGVSNSSRAGLGYNLKLGFGVSPRWSIVFAADGAQAYFDNVSVNQTAWTVGPQVFLTRKLYARAGIGAATRTYDYGNNYNGYTTSYPYGSSTSDSGMATTGALGIELTQSYHTALAVEAVGTLGYYPNKEKLSTFGVNFILNLF